ncbi:23S rRNA (pseudouridine(1915)-N(3))-methyltransferase RlmH [bacterium SCSIO 12741]|nr:23S rRNA (pseudouridine(1915)-N(3))-methyltransferase RlmH [bacterium SCSIO 12741]
MKIRVISVGKTQEKYLLTGMQEYQKRLSRFTRMEWVEIPALRKGKSLSEKETKDQEGKLILSEIGPSDFVVLLDEKGKEYSSEKWARQMDKWMQGTHKSLVFVIGGAYGFSEDVYQRSQDKLALSQMTFSHQMIRLFFIEQIYRGFTILKGMPYHHS